MIVLLLFCSTSLWFYHNACKLWILNQRSFLHCVFVTQRLRTRVQADVKEFREQAAKGKAGGCVQKEKVKEGEEKELSKPEKTNEAEVRAESATMRQRYTRRTTRTSNLTRQPRPKPRRKRRARRRKAARRAPRTRTRAMTSLRTSRVLRRAIRTSP